MSNRSASNKLSDVPIETTMGAVNDYLLSIIGGVVSRINPTNFASVISSLLATSIKKRAVRTVTASSFSVLTSDSIIICDASSNTIAANFPASTDLVTDGETLDITIIRHPDSVNDVTIFPNGAEEIDTGSSVPISSGSKSVISDGNNLFTHG